jgi:hypothetical protein
MPSTFIAFETKWFIDYLCTEERVVNNLLVCAVAYFIMQRCFGGHLA